MYTLFKILVSLLIASTPLRAFALESSYNEPRHINIANRPLVKTPKRVISVVDVTKRMNLLLQLNHPEVLKSKAMLYQFYTTHWRSVLEQMINSELICSEAEEKKIEISDGDVREEMEEQFGPNVMATLTRLDISYEEAREFVHSSLIERQMMWINVYRKVVQSVTPAVVKGAYTAYLDQNPPNEQWTYQVMTIRGAPRDMEDAIASVTSQLFAKKLSELSANTSDITLLKEHPEIKISISDDLIVNRKSASKEHLAILQTLSPSTVSTPVRQFSRADQSEVLRAFYLKDYEKTDPPAFAEISLRLKDQVMSNAQSIFSQEYLSRLRKHYNMDRDNIYDMIPPDFQPYSAS